MCVRTGPAGRSGRAGAAGAGAAPSPPRARPARWSPRASPGKSPAGRGTGGESHHLRRRVWEKFGGIRGGRDPKAPRRHVGRAGGGRGRRAPRGINSWPRCDRRGCDWRCRPPPRRVGRGGALGAGGVGEADSSVLAAAAGGRGGGAERGVEGGVRERGEGGGHHCSPRRALCRRRRLGGWGSVRRRGRGGAARSGARCFVSSSPCGAARAAGEAPAPFGLPANGGGGGG